MTIIAAGSRGLPSNLFQFLLSWCSYHVCREKWYLEFAEWSTDRGCLVHSRLVKDGALPRTTNEEVVLFPSSVTVLLVGLTSSSSWRKISVDFIVDEVAIAKVMWRKEAVPTWRIEHRNGAGSSSSLTESIWILYFQIIFQTVNASPRAILWVFFFRSIRRERLANAPCQNRLVPVGEYHTIHWQSSFHNNHTTILQVFIISFYSPCWVAVNAFCRRRPSSANGFW